MRKCSVVPMGVLRRGSSVGAAALLMVLAVPVAAHAKDDSAELPAAAESESAGWIDLVNEEGPVGLNKPERAGLSLCGDAKLARESGRLTTIEGSGVVAVTSRGKGSEVGNLTSKQRFGDCEIYLEFLIGEKSNSGVKLQHRYEVQLYDSHDRKKPSATDCGGIYPHWIYPPGGGRIEYIDEGFPPTENAAKPAGEWQTLRIVFKAPRFDEEGNKTSNARMESVVLNGKTIHEDVELESPTGNTTSPMREVPEAPLMLQLDHGAVAFRNVRVRPM